MVSFRGGLVDFDQDLIQLLAHPRHAIRHLSATCLKCHGCGIQLAQVTPKTLNEAHGLFLYQTEGADEIKIWTRAMVEEKLTVDTLYVEQCQALEQAPHYLMLDSIPYLVHYAHTDNESFKLSAAKAFHLLCSLTSVQDEQLLHAMARLLMNEEEQGIKQEVAKGVSLLAGYSLDTFAALHYLLSCISVIPEPLPTRHRIPSFTYEPAIVAEMLSKLNK